MRIAVVPAHDEVGGIGETVRALRGLVDVVVVADDGSRDGTGPAALEAGAIVLRGRRRAGKGAAATAGVRRALEEAPAMILLADADLGSTASGLEPLVAAVERGEAAVAIGVLPPQGTGGFGAIRRWAAAAIAERTAWEPQAPLSGQRALTREAAGSLLPFADGFGMEVGMTLDALGRGLVVREIPVQVHHRPPGKTPAGVLHRARQGADIVRAVRRRG